MLKNIYKVAFTLQLLLCINTINAMDNQSIGIGNTNVEMHTLNKEMELQNNAKISFDEVPELKQREILMDLYHHPMYEWKNIYHKYSFESDNIAYNKKYSSDEYIS